MAVVNILLEDTWSAVLSGPFGCSTHMDEKCTEYHIGIHGAVLCFNISFFGHSALISSCYHSSS